MKKALASALTLTRAGRDMDLQPYSRPMLPEKTEVFKGFCSIEQRANQGRTKDEAQKTCQNLT